MRVISFSVEGIPKAQPRARAIVRGKYAVFYTPKSADEWKALIIQKAHNYLEEEPIRDPITISLLYRMPIPKRYEKIIKNGDPHIKKPDIDNLNKSVFDALVSSGLLRDDSIIYKNNSTKVYEKNDIGITIVIGVCDAEDKI